MNRHAKLVGIDVRHGYFAGGWCPDLDVAAADDTLVRLRNHRCVFKPRQGGADAYVEVDAAGKPLIPFPAGSTLAFRLMPRNPDFALYTDPAPLADGPDYQLGHPAQPGGDVLTVTIQRDFNAAAGANVALQFAAKQAPWVFYLVTDRPGPDSDFAIASSGAQPAWHREAVDAGDAAAAQLVRQYPGARVLRFVTGAPVPCSENGLAGLRLLHGGSPVLQNLPAPSWRNFSRAKLAATGNNVDALTQVVKYLSNTSLTKV